MEELSLSFLGPQVGATPGHPAGPPARQMTVNIGKLSKELAKRWTNVTSQVGGRMVEHFTIWLFNIAMDNGPFIDGLPIKNGDFPWLC